MVREKRVLLGRFGCCPLGAAMRESDAAREVGRPQFYHAARALEMNSNYCHGVARGWDGTHEKREHREGWSSSGLSGWRYGRRMRRVVLDSWQKNDIAEGAS